MLFYGASSIVSAKGRLLVIVMADAGTLDFAVAPVKKNKNETQGVVRHNTEKDNLTNHNAFMNVVAHPANCTFSPLDNFA